MLRCKDPEVAVTCTFKVSVEVTESELLLVRMDLVAISPVRSLIDLFSLAPTMDRETERVPFRTKPCKLN
jgi:hypothetical protein